MCLLVVYPPLLSRLWQHCVHTNPFNFTLEIFDFEGTLTGRCLVSEYQVLAFMVRRILISLQV